MSNETESNIQIIDIDRIRETSAPIYCVDETAYSHDKQMHEGYIAIDVVSETVEAKSTWSDYATDFFPESPVLPIAVSGAVSGPHLADYLESEEFMSDVQSIIDYHNDDYNAKRRQHEITCEDPRAVAAYNRILGTLAALPDSDNLDEDGDED